MPSATSPRQPHSPYVGHQYTATTPTGSLNSHGYSPTYTSNGGGPLSPSIGGGGPGSSNLNSNSFIFPIRSVFQGMATGDSTSSIASDAGGGGGGGSGEGGGGGGGSLNRVNSRGQSSQAGAAGGRANYPRQTPSRTDERRFSQSFGAMEQDVGIASIAQLLQGEDDGKQRERPKPSGHTGTATFSGKVDRSSGGGNGNTAGSPKGSPYGIAASTSTRNIPGSGIGTPAGTPASSSKPGTTGFFSVPLIGETETSDSPFFRDTQQEIRRSSDGTGGTTTAANKTPRTPAEEPPHRPDMKEEDSAGTVRLAPNRSPQLSPSLSTSERKAENPSAEASGSGLPQRERAPVGQPQEEPSSVNFSDRPGSKEHIGEKQSFSSSGNKEDGSRMQNDEKADGADEASLKITGPPKTRDKSPTGITAPQPRRAGSSGLEGLSQITKASPTAAAAASLGDIARAHSTFDSSEDGERQLINDFASIVRLGEAGSISGTAGGTGTASKGSKDGLTGTGRDSRSRRTGKAGESTDASSGGGPSGPTTHARLAQQQREIGKSSAASRDTIERFIKAQAETENLSDPNAPTPVPGQRSQTQSPADRLRSSPRDGDTSSAPSTPARPDDSGYIGSGGASAPHTGGGDYHDQDTDTDLDHDNSTRESSEIAAASVGDSGDADVSGEGEADPETEEEEPVVTLRFEHVATEDGHHVVVGREGKLRHCEDEPITTPGAVQGFGVLMVLEEDYEKGTLLVRQVSEVSGIGHVYKVHRLIEVERD